MIGLAPSSVEEAERVILETWKDRRQIHLDPDDVSIGAVPLTLKRLNRIAMLNPDDGVVTVEAGVAVQAIDVAARSVGLWCPALRHLSPDIPIGAAVAGGHGWRTLRFGSLADYLLGSRFVCPGVGAVRHGGTAIKNATGYNLTGLLAASRGAFGIILSLNLRLVPLPPARAVRCFAASSAVALQLAAELASDALGRGDAQRRADSVEGRIPVTGSECILRIDVSDFSDSRVADNLRALDALADQFGARRIETADWNRRPEGTRLSVALPPTTLPNEVRRLLNPPADKITEIRFEATGGGLELWTIQADRSSFALPAPSSASLAFRETLRRAVDPDGLLDGPG